MILISHRGNLNGKNPSQENRPEYIDRALKEYDVEIDVWYIDGEFHLGHDRPSYRIDEEYLEERRSRLWIHCKNKEALIKLHGGYNCFFHEDDDVVLTSHNVAIAHVNYGAMKSTIVMMPEVHGYSRKDLDGCIGICSDVIRDYE